MTTKLGVRHESNADTGKLKLYSAVNGRLLFNEIIDPKTTDFVWLIHKIEKAIRVAEREAVRNTGNKFAELADQWALELQ